MIILQYVIFLFAVGCFLFVGSDADCIEYIAEKRQREGIMAKFTPITAEGCVQTCEQLNTCFAVNYFRLNATCQLLNRTMPESKLIKTTKCLYKAIRRPSQESIDNDPCFKLTCPWDEICMHNTTTNLPECYPLCESPPAIPGTLNETVEIEVSQNYTYKCRDGLLEKIDQTSTVTCLKNGHWTGTNFTCVCESPPVIKGTINETIEIEVSQNYTYKCWDGLFGKIDQISTVTCLKDGHWTGTNFTCPPSASCDMGYKNITLEIFYFCIKVYLIKTPFNQAMTKCESDKAKLLVITTRNQINDLKNYLPRGWTFAGIWDKDEEGIWKGWDGKQVRPFWNPGEPDGGMNENCGVIASDQIGLLDKQCISDHYFVCSKT
ncbi:hypothetical protein ACJMK2_001861 [Sinanodonta woodiana]|uniref:Uncharacterized protein n=1 Tax=Sinanodonta woodiana TaxID=1069815 RepID=A0ABD3XX04_SINWO